MKKIVVFALMLSSLLPAIAQELTGKLVFLEVKTFKFDEKRFEQMSEERRERMKEGMKKWGRSKKVLLFNDSASVYRNYSAELDAKEGESWEEDGQHKHWKRMRPTLRIHQNLRQKETVEQQEFFDKKFLITDVQEQLKWKLTGKQEKVLNYMCQEAVALKDDTVEVRAYFTPQIPVATGPQAFGALPGMILKLDINKGETVIEAQEFRAETPSASDMKKPEKGKRVTREEFYEIRRAKMEEMRQMGGGGWHGHH